MLRKLTASALTSMNSAGSSRQSGFTMRNGTRKDYKSYNHKDWRTSSEGMLSSLGDRYQSLGMRQVTSVPTVSTRAISQSTAATTPASIVTFSPQDTFQLSVLIGFIGPLIPQLADNPPPLFLQRLGLTLPSQLCARPWSTAQQQRIRIPQRVRFRIPKKIRIELSLSAVFILEE